MPKISYVITYALAGWQLAGCTPLESTVLLPDGSCLPPSQVGVWSINSVLYIDKKSPRIGVAPVTLTRHFSDSDSASRVVMAYAELEQGILKRQREHLPPIPCLQFLSPSSVGETPKTSDKQR